jgi:hypothetical protein
MYSKTAICLNQKVESTESETGQPNQVPIQQAHDHMHYNTFIQIWAQKTIMK